MFVLNNKHLCQSKPQCHHEGLRANPGEPEAVPRIPETGQNMQSASSTLCGERNTEDRAAPLMSQHELDQEYLYRLWKAGKISETYVQIWVKALSELQDEAPCDYFVWLMQQNPALVGAF